MSKVIGTIKVIGEDKEFGYTDIFTIKHENRVVHIVKCEDGTIGIHTIRIAEDGKQVQTGYRFSRETLSMLTAAILFATKGWKINIEGFLSMITNGNDEIEVEFGKGSTAWDNITKPK